MDAEQARAFLLALPHVVETAQWGNNLVFWVGNKHLGGKMFALIDLEPAGKAIISYAAGAERYAVLLEQEGLIPAPYMARIFWVAAEVWAVHRDAVWHTELRAAHQLTWIKLPAKTQAILHLPAIQRKRLIAAREDTLRRKAQMIRSPETPTVKKQSASRQATPKATASKTRTSAVAKAPLKKLGRPTKAAKAVSLASASRAAKPKKHRQS